MNLVDVRLAPAGRTVELDAGELRLQTGEQIVVEDGRGGTRLAVVALPTGWRTPPGPVGQVLRRAGPEDLARGAAGERRDQQALEVARACARDLGLALKLFRIERAADDDRTIFYLSADRRIELQALAQALAAHFPERLELRQVGVRDEAKGIGGIGSCGRELCCTTFLPRFSPVTLPMARDQNLALNPVRVSGQCGRLKCCLVYEEAQYLEAPGKPG